MLPIKAGPLGLVDGGTRGTVPADAGPMALEVRDGIALSGDIALRFARNGPHAEYKEFHDRTISRFGRDAFSVVDHAVNGKGGFQDGTYLDPHLREVSVTNPQTGITTLLDTSRASAKFQKRKQLADYDNFARAICNTYWGYIVQQKDEIRRVCEGAQVDEILSALVNFWDDVDRKGSKGMAIEDFDAAVFKQARQTTIGCVIVDRPANAVRSQRENALPENRPYAYLVPTRNMVDWEYDEDGNLSALAILEPDPAHFEGLQPLRIWTRYTWAIYLPQDNGAQNTEGYQLKMSGRNPLGEVPAVFLYNEEPDPEKHFGETEMVAVAGIARTTYNIDSEIREVERNCAFPVFCVPMKNPSTIRTLVISTEGALGYDGEGGGSPQFVSADLSVLEKLQSRRDKKVEQAYAMAHLAVLSGYVQTSSGFHSQAEFDKSNRRIGEAAAAIERFEIALSRLFLRWYGLSDEEIKEGNLFSITFPRDFKLLEVEALVEKTTKLLALGLGKEANINFLTDLFSSLYPRLSTEEVNELAVSAAEFLESKAAASPFGPGAALNPREATKQRIRQQLAEGPKRLKAGAGEEGATAKKPEDGEPVVAASGNVNEKAG